MDSLELLAREDEFKKLNKQLEKKTESLMKEIEQAMQKQDIFTAFSPNLTLSPVHSTRKHSCDAQTTNTTPTKTTPKIKKNISGIEKNIPPVAQTIDTQLENTVQSQISEKSRDMRTCVKENVCVCCTDHKFGQDTEFLYAFVAVNVKDKVLPASFTKDRPTVENVCKFLASKAKLMQDQIDKLQSTLDKKASQCDGHLTQLAELEGERMSLLNKTNTMRTSTAEMKNRCAVLQNKLNDKDKLYKEQRSEADRLAVELKRVKTKHVSIQAKCASQEETIENLKQQLETAKRVEKEFRESSRNLSTSHQNAISRLEAQIKLLTTRIDRQMALIDNLRRQNVLLSTEASLRGLEKDYSDLLHQDL